MKIIYAILAASAILFIFFNIGNAMEIIKTRHILESAVDSTKVKNINQNKGIGIGPIKKMRLGAIDDKLVNEGKNIFSDKCSACHSLDVEVEGPALRKITKKLRPEYIMNYLLNTAEMQKKDTQLKELIKKYNGEAMPDLELKQSQARALLEYFRSSAK
jgi:mono/diheme cytochrome c family protein